jgi:hypothetical protein
MKTIKLIDLQASSSYEMNFTSSNIFTCKVFSSSDNSLTKEISGSYYLDSTGSADVSGSFDKYIINIPSDPDPIQGTGYIIELTDYNQTNKIVASKILQNGTTINRIYDLSYTVVS